MFFKLKHFVVFLKILTCLLTSRPFKKRFHAKDIALASTLDVLLTSGYNLYMFFLSFTGIDSRYFDQYDPPDDVTCVDLDTNTISL